MGNPFRLFGCGAAIVAFALFAGASMTACQANGPSLGLLNAAEPKTILIRNRSGISFDRLRLSAPGRPGSSAHRFGAIGPVLDGIDQVLVRPASPPPLPPSVAVTLERENAAAVQANVSLKTVLSQASGHPSEILVFELRPMQNVVVYLCRGGF